jgi:hypothetical protein
MKDIDYDLCMATEDNNLEVVKQLVGKGANIKVLNNYPIRKAKKMKYKELSNYFNELLNTI